MEIQDTNWTGEVRLWDVNIPENKPVEPYYDTKPGRILKNLVDSRKMLIPAVILLMKNDTFSDFLTLPALY